LAIPAGFLIPGAGRSPRNARLVCHRPRAESIEGVRFIVQNVDIWNYSLMTSH